MFHINIGRKTDESGKEKTFIDKLTLYQKRGKGNPHRLTFDPALAGRFKEHYGGDAPDRHFHDFDLQHPRFFTTGGALLSPVPPDLVPALSTEELGVLIVEKTRDALDTLSRSPQGISRIGEVMKACANWRGQEKLDPRPDRWELLNAVLPELTNLSDEEASWTVLKPYVSGPYTLFAVLSVWLAFSISWQAYLLTFRELPMPWPRHLTIVEILIAFSWFFLLFPMIEYGSTLKNLFGTARNSIRQRMPSTRLVLRVGIAGSICATASLAAVIVFRFLAR